MNSPIAEQYILNSSDSRSFKIKPQINIPLFDSNNSKHKKLLEISKLAHVNCKNKEKMKLFDTELDLMVAKLNRGFVR